MLGTLRRREIEQVLKDATVGRIGVAVDGLTYVVPITFVYDGDSVYGHSRLGQKIRMMRKNPRVCFQVDQITDMANWRCVIAQGQFEELSGDLAVAAARLIAARLRPLTTSETAGPRGVARGRDATISYRIRLSTVSGRYERATRRRSRGRTPRSTRTRSR